jgi:hypothetical protein
MTNRPELAELEYPVSLVHTVCALAGNPAYVDDLKRGLQARGILKAVDDHDSPKLFEWLVEAMSYQGISDAIAADYMKRHGRATWRAVQAGLGQSPSCPKLGSYWQFHGCQYRKSSGTCAEPRHLPGCPVPRHRLRNGNLNQMAYSLFFFIRDIAGGDLVAWLDSRLAEADCPAAPDRVARMRQAVLGPLRHVYAASDKVLSVALSSLLLGGGVNRNRWAEVGAAMVAVDTLVHNFLARTGILDRLNAAHPYGPACYRPGGCAEIIERVAESIDAREFNPEFPATFPRFVQAAIWRYCAQDGFDVCNGNRIDDTQSCSNVYCRVYSSCDRMPLYRQRADAA